MAVGYLNNCGRCSGISCRSIDQTKVRRTVQDLVAQDILKVTTQKKENKLYYSISEKFMVYWNVLNG